MMRSLFSGVAGLKNHQTRMDVIGNNIANVNTTGYKSSRVTFADTLNQTLTASSSATDTTGGTNAKEIGLGVGVASIDTLMTSGSVESTGVNTDLCLSGSGFFVAKDGANSYYTRDGAFSFDSAGNYVTSSGLYVQGWNATNGVVNTSGATQNIKVSVDSSMAAEATATATYSGNLSSDTDTSGTVSTSLTVYDSLGTKHTVPVTLTKSATANTWSATTSSATIDGATATGTFTDLVFDSSGNYVSGSGSLTLTGYANGAADSSVAVDFSGLTQNSGESTASASTDGYASGTLSNVAFDSKGVLTGTYSNGEKQTLAQIAIASFNNSSGLEKSGTSLYTESNNSGQAKISTIDGTSGTTLTASSLEMSNVDLASEFSNMIVTQRGFQSNSKIITVADEMLQTLVNMKQ